MINSSGQTVSLLANDDLLVTLRKQADAGEIVLEVGSSEPKRAPRKKAASRED